MPHFLINSNNINDNLIIIQDKEILNHLAKSLRVRIGEEVLFFDENEMQYEAIAKDINLSRSVFYITNRYKSLRKLNFHLALAQSVLKSDAQTSVIQKATELGVKEIIPLLTDNCTIKESFIRTKIDKWQKIAFESVKQCKRADIPKVLELSTLQKVVGEYDEVFVFVEKYAMCNFGEYIERHRVDKDAKILVVIGCEGGFSEKEFQFMKDNNIPMLTLSNLILRADTAVAAALITVINGLNND